MSQRLYLGTYARNGGAGLQVLRPTASAGWSIGETHPHPRNASFGTFSARHGLYYFVEEEAEGTLGVFRESAAGWERLASVPTHGAEPCYVALNGDESCVAVANYGSGSVALFRLDARTGLPQEPPVVRREAGRGPVKDRQDGPHAHCTCFSPDQRWLFHVDLGTDEILVYPVDPETASLGERRVAFHAPRGTGPRHLVFHPILPLALLLSELASTLTVLQVEGRLSLIVVLDQFSRSRHTPRAFAQNTAALALAMDGLEHGDFKALATPWFKITHTQPLGH